jgi:hypothetical protein
VTPPRTAHDRTEEEPQLVAVVPPELQGLPDEPTEPLDLDAFERWAATGEGDPWAAG